MVFPISPSTFGAFLLTASAIVLSPGPDTVIILRHTLRAGTRVGLATVAGVQAGLMGHTILAVLGISMLIAANPILFKTVAVSGSLYIAWIGLQSFRAEGLLHIGTSDKPLGGAKAFRDAIFCNLLNPKVILLFLALFPNFVDTTRDDVSLQLLTLALGLIVINTLWQVPLAFMAQAVRRWLKNPRIYRLVMHTTGTILIALAVAMAAENLL